MARRELEKAHRIVALWADRWHSSISDEAREELIEAIEVALKDEREAERLGHNHG